MLKRSVRTPTVLQMETVECGAASLCIILRHYGRVVPLEKLRLECGVSRDGSKASNILKAARLYGFEAKGFRYETSNVRVMHLPAIVFWNFNHFLVVDAFVDDQVLINDPATGPRKIALSEFDKSFTGVAMEFRPGPQFEAGGQKRGIFQYLGPRLQSVKTALAFVTLAALALVIPGLLIPTFAKIFIDDYLIQQKTDWIRPLLLGMVLTVITLASMTFLQQRHLLRLERSLSIRMSAGFMWHILNLPIQFFQQRFAGDISQRMRSNDTVARLMAGDVATNVVNILTIVFFAMVMFQYSISLTLMTIASVVINIMAISYISRVQKDSTIKIQQDHSKLIASTIGGIQIIETLKASGGEAAFFSKWAGNAANLTNTKQAIGLKLLFLQALPTLLDDLSRILVICFGGVMIIEGDLTVGGLVAYQTLVASFMRPVSQLLALVQRLQTIEADITRISDVLDYPKDPNTVNRIGFEAMTFDLPSRAAGRTKLHGHLELRNIFFGYNPLDPPLIQDFNLILKPGKRVALVGGSGSGKSTIARMVAGINQPWSGSILFDGKPREEIPRTLLASSLAHVDQEISMFGGTIRDNLTMWDEAMMDSSVLKGAKDAQIHHDIATRPAGYQGMVLERGANFSGGETQRLEIARALAQEPSLLVMDEATSALDPLTEKQIDDSIRRRGCSMLIIAHRLSTIRDADEIIVLDKGIIVQRGTHKDLIGVQGLYADLIGTE